MVKWGGKENTIIPKCVCPSSGTLTMIGLAREKVYDNYNSGTTPSTPYSLYDLVNGGYTNGSGVNFESTNADSTSRPNTGTPHGFLEWYSYDHDATGGGPK